MNMGAVTVENEFYPDSAVSLALFKDVNNAAELRQCVMNGTFEAALLKTSMIVDPFQVLVAANRAIHLNKLGKMMTKNVHSEILFSLSPLKSISDSFRKFGLDDADQSVLIVISNDKDGKVLDIVSSKIKGQMADLSEISSFTDIKNVKKVYKITDSELTCGSLVDGVVSRISSQDIVNL